MIGKKALKRRERRGRREELLCHVRDQFEQARRLKKDLCGLCDLCASSFGRLKQS
ncbi:MAG TPA: hypothetical protein VM073_03420 [Usitatibacter sp.]|nr:hypothetical protein [Usitatibacter sp.]